MMYLSQLLGAAVEDVQGVRVGKIMDVLVDAITETNNRVPTLVVEGEAEQRWFVPVGGGADGIHRTSTGWQISADAINRVLADSATSAGQVSLAREVLDKQVIDIEHKKAVRVNDVCFGDDWRILGIDNSALGLVRRLAPSWLLGARSKRPPATLIPWDRIQLIGEWRVPDEDAQQEEDRQAAQEDWPGSERIARRRGQAQGPHIHPTPPIVPTGRGRSGQLAELRPADIADIVYQLTPGQGARLLEGLDDETAADALEELDTERQSHILENISAERAADILQEMEPDEAADLVARLPEERAQELLRLMTPQESEDVQELLVYEEDTAGGIMTTNFVAIDATKTAGDALEAVRFNIREQDVRLAYIYCIADEASEDYTLLGIVSLWNLLVADAAQPLQELMETDLVTVQPDAEPRAVAQIMAKYNFLAVPVVSEAGTLEGVVTIDDALDILLGERHKPHRMY